MRIVLVAGHASIDFGGEAALPCHYFRVLLTRNVDVHLVVHKRSERFLSKAFPQSADRIHYVEDSRLHLALFNFGKLFPKRLRYMTFGFCLRVLFQVLQRRLVRNLISVNDEVVVHQIIPVSPKEPSIMCGLGVPVVFGPLNGGMHYPKGFKGYEGRLSHWFGNVARLLSEPLNCFFRGKREAATIMVANKRTELALPKGLQGSVKHIVENGVDLSLWQGGVVANNDNNELPTFVYVGRLVDWKALDILLDAFFVAINTYGAMNLHIIGDGDQRDLLEKMVAQQELAEGKVNFHGWVAQADIAPILASSDVLVLTSIYECGGAVVLEAMASSLPVIATNWGGPADYIDSECGILVDPTSRSELVDGFSAAMVKLAENPELARGMGANGRKKIEEQYDWERKVDVVQDVYRDVLDACQDQP